MRDLLNPDNRVMNLISKVIGCAYLNILWFLCCIPVFTVGASTTALFTVTLKMSKNEEGNIGQQFFRAFRDNFKQGVKTWMIMFVVSLALLLDGYVFYHMRYANALWAIGTAIFLVATAAWLIICMYIFPLMARFDNTISAMFRNSFLIGMRFLLCTALMAVIYFIMAYIVINVFTPAIVFGEGLCAYLCSCLLNGILDQCEPKDKSGDPAR